jgi:hypothetical protein
VGFVVDKATLRQLSSECLVSPANSHSIDCCTLIIIIITIYHLGLVQ